MISVSVGGPASGSIPSALSFSFLASYCCCNHEPYKIKREKERMLSGRKKRAYVSESWATSYIFLFSLFSPWLGHAQFHEYLRLSKLGSGTFFLPDWIKGRDHFRFAVAIFSLGSLLRLFIAGILFHFRYFETSSFCGWRLRWFHRPKKLRNIVRKYEHVT